MFNYSGANLYNPNNGIGQKSPFNSSFFKLFISLGLFDFIHLLEDWIIGKFSNYEWFWVDDFVMINPQFFSKLNSMLWWFAGIGKTLGVTILAAYFECGL